MMMESIGYILSGLISTLICVCACKLCKKRGSRWIRRLMEIDTGVVNQKDRWKKCHHLGLS